MSAARGWSRNGRSALPRTAPRFPSSLRNSAAGWRASCRRTGRRSPPPRSTPPTRRRPAVATRKASQQTLEALAPALPELIGGSADLTGSVFTDWSGSKAVTRTEAGNYLNFGVREFAMCAIANGLALHGGFIPYVGTFLTFSDYARNALRMAALIRLRAVFVFTHDSIGLGEDGPTHQAVEHTASLRLIPHLDVWRPGDTVETAVGVGRGDRARRRPDRAHPHAAERAVRAARRPRDRRHPPRRLRARRLRGHPRRAPRRADRHRFRARARRRGAQRARGRRHRRARRVAALHQRVRAAGGRLSGRACSPSACRASRSKPA